MPRRRKSVAPQTDIHVLLERIETLEKTLRTVVQAKMSSVAVIDIENFNDPIEGMDCIDWPTGRFCWYHDGEWICVPADAVHAIKVYSDKKQTAGGDCVFRFPIEPDLDNTVIVMMKAFVGTASSSDTELTLVNHARGDLDLLSTPLVIPAGGMVSNKATIADDIIESIVTGRQRNHVLEDEMMWINVSASNNGKGLGMYIYFAPAKEDNSV